MSKLVKIQIDDRLIQFIHSILSKVAAMCFGGFGVLLLRNESNEFGLVSFYIFGIAIVAFVLADFSRLFPQKKETGIKDG